MILNVIIHKRKDRRADYIHFFKASVYKKNILNDRQRINIIKQKPSIQTDRNRQFP